MEKIKVGMAGFGKGGRIYNAPIIASVEGLEITRIMTSSSENIAAAHQDFPDAEVSPEYEAILNDPDLDLVVITTPNHLHREFVSKALEAGKHVVVEKPFTPSVKEADELIELARKNNKILSVHHNRRWASDILTIKKLLNVNKLGKVVEFEAHFDRFRTEVTDTWKDKTRNPGSGVFYDLGSHLIDQALILFGFPEEVFADLRIQRENATVTDNFGVLLFYPNLKVTLKGGMLVKELGPTYSIHGTKGSFVKYGADPQEELMKKGLKPKDVPEWGKEPKEIWGKLNTVEGSGLIESEPGEYTSFYRNIYNAILGKEELIVKPEQARNVIRIIELAEQSSSEKCRVKLE